MARIRQIFPGRLALGETVLKKIVLLLLLCTACTSFAQTPGSTLNKYCTGCHNDKARTGGLSLQSMDLANPTRNAETWEKVIRKLRTGAMPPPGLPRPDHDASNGLASYLETSLDRAAAATPNPGHASMHRLNRTEYANAIHDLLGLDIDSAALLPPDDESNGFDNIADVLRMSPSLMERYLSASWNISREAVGDMNIASATTTYRVRPDLSQDQHIEGLPLGTRGGIAVKHYFPLDAEYIIKVRLWRNTFDLMRGMEDPHQIEISIDGQRAVLVTAGGKSEFTRMASNPGEYDAELDRKLTVRLPLKAGPHMLTSSVILRSHAEQDALIKPFLQNHRRWSGYRGRPVCGPAQRGGSFRCDGPRIDAVAGEGVCLQAGGGSGRSAVRAQDYCAVAEARLPEADRGPGSRDPAQFLPAAAQRER